MTLYGDTSGQLGGHEKGGHQRLTLQDNVGRIAYGDANVIADNARGGDDALTGGANAINEMFGDANIVEGHAQGGDDTLIAGLNAFTKNGLNDFKDSVTLVGVSDPNVLHASDFWFA